MDIDVITDPRAHAAADAQSSRTEYTIMQHRALCQLSLPPAGGKGSWHRDVGAAAVSIEVPAISPTLPGGSALRLLLMHICDTALRNGSAAVEIGESPAALAEQMPIDAKGAKLRELAEQFERMMGAKITVSLDGGPALSVFDARGRPRAVAPEWRTMVRLNARFFAALADCAVALDRRVVSALADTPLALDAYMWMTSVLTPTTPEAPAGISWADLAARFAQEDQPEDAFRAAFEDAVRRVTAACPTLVVIMGEQGVQVRPASAERVAPERPAPAERPAPERAQQERPAPERAPRERAAPQAVQPPPPETVRQPAPQPAPKPVVAETPAPQPQVETPAESLRQSPRQSISLKSHMTGLSQVIWLQRANGRENQVIEITPGGRYDPDHLTVLALEPMVVQISGGLYDREFERVSAWAMNNRDLIDDFWDGKIDTFDEIASRVKKVPAPGWR